VNLLIDTHLLLWTLLGDRSLSARARQFLTNPDHALYFSAASVWEIAIKTARRRPAFIVDPLQLRDEMLDNGYVEVPVTSDHAATTLALPPLHGDPFDRILLAQAIVEDLTLLTSDRALARYPGPIQLV
jgi:PIN domain nuclease of toxin-antitoxin system